MPSQPVYVPDVSGPVGVIGVPHTSFTTGNEAPELKGVNVKFDSVNEKPGLATLSPKSFLQCLQLQQISISPEALGANIPTFLSLCQKSIAARE